MEQEISKGIHNKSLETHSQSLNNHYGSGPLTPTLLPRLTDNEASKSTQEKTLIALKEPGADLLTFIDKMKFLIYRKKNFHISIFKYIIYIF